MVESEDISNNYKTLEISIGDVTDQYKVQEICDKVILKNGGMTSLFLSATRIKTCVIKLLIALLMH